MSDIYGTKEPMTAFHQRITFCLDLHNSSVKVTCGTSQLVTQHDFANVIYAVIIWSVCYAYCTEAQLNIISCTFRTFLTSCCVESAAEIACRTSVTTVYRWLLLMLCVGDAFSTEVIQ